MTTGRNSQRDGLWLVPVIGCVLLCAAWVLARQTEKQLPIPIEFLEQDREFLRAEFPGYVLPLERARLGTLLSDAIEAEDESEVVRLLDAGADADSNGPQYARTSHSGAPLFHAIRKGNPRIVEALIQRGARVSGPDWEDQISCRNEFGQTPLYFAVRCQQPEIVDLLLDHDAMIAGSNSSGKTALVGAVEAANLDIFNQLIRRGAVCDFGSAYPADRYYKAPYVTPELMDGSVWPFSESITTPLKLIELARRSPNQELAAAVEKQFRTSPEFSPQQLAEIAVRSDDVAALRKMMANGYNPAEYRGGYEKKTTLLDVAAIFNKVRCFELLKELNIPQTQALPRNSTLRLLAAAGSVARLKRRLANGAVFGTYAPNRGSPLKLAALAERLEMVEFLLQRPEAKETWLRSPSLLAAVMPLASTGALDYRTGLKSRTICRKLIEAGAVIPTTPVDSLSNPLLRAAAAGWIDVYELLQQQAPTLVDHSEALKAAALCNRTDMCRYLLSRKADPTISDWPIKSAFHNRNEKLVKLLMAAGVKGYPKQFDVSGGYNRGHDYGHPLYNAALSGDTEFCRRLIRQFPGSAVWEPIQYDQYEYDNDIEYFDKGNTPLFAPVFRDHADTLRLLLQYTQQHDQNGKPLLDINARNSFGATALHMAVMYGATKCTQLLIAAGADVTINGNTDRWGEGNSLLHLSTRDPFAPHHHKQSQHGPDVNVIVPMLIAANVRMGSEGWINQKNRWGKTPLHVHAEARHEKACQMLIAHGANVNAVTESGTTVLSSAMQNHHSFHPTPEKRRIERSRVCINLIEAGADYSGLRRDGKLSHCGSAYRNGLFDFVDELQRRGVVPDLENEAAEYLCAAVFYNEHDALKHWIAEGADINSHAVDGDTALHTAARVHDVGACRLLLSKGADPNAVGNDDMPVMFRVFRQYHNHMGTFYRPEMNESAAAILTMLLDAGADPLLRHSEQKKTVLEAFDKMPEKLRELIETRVGQ